MKSPGAVLLVEGGLKALPGKPALSQAHLRPHQRAHHSPHKAVGFYHEFIQAVGMAPFRPDHLAAGMRVSAKFLAEGGKIVFSGQKRSGLPKAAQVEAVSHFQRIGSQERIRVSVNPVAVSAAPRAVASMKIGSRFVEGKRPNVSRQQSIEPAQERREQGTGGFPVGYLPPGVHASVCTAGSYHPNLLSCQTSQARLERSGHRGDLRLDLPAGVLCAVVGQLQRIPLHGKGRKIATPATFSRRLSR